MRYAATTGVSSERSKAEIERTLRRYGAAEFVSGWNDKEAMIGFKVAERMIKFVVPLPDREEFTKTFTGRERKNTAAIERQWEQACRQRWRALALTVKARLEAVEAGIETIEAAFLANVVLPDGRTFGQWARPALMEAYANRKMPKMLGLE